MFSVRYSYQANINEKWIPALDGVQQQLSTGTRVADIGCGHGSSTLIMAKAFPNSEFYGFDLHLGSIEAATRKSSNSPTFISALPRQKRSRVATTDW
jgi:trans-aconitate methyltransferase